MQSGEKMKNISGIDFDETSYDYTVHVVDEAFRDSE